MIPLDQSLPVQADLRYLLDLCPGQTTAQINLGAHLKIALENDGLFTVPFALDVLPNTASLDSIFLAAPFSLTLDAVLKVCVQSLKPDGQVLLCIPNLSLKRLLTGNRQRAYSLAAARKAANNAGLTIRGTYGIYESLAEPRFLVPLEDPKVAEHFFNFMLTPYTRLTRLLVTVAPYFTALNLHPILFTDICIVLDLPC